MAVSLKLVIGVIIVVVAAVTAVVAFVPTYLSGQSAVRTNVESIRAGIMNNIQLQVGEYFRRPIPVLHGIRDGMRRGLFTMTQQSMLDIVLDSAQRYPPDSERAVFIALADGSFALGEAFRGAFIGGSKVGMFTPFHVRTFNVTTNTPLTTGLSFTLQFYMLPVIRDNWYPFASRNFSNTVWTPAKPTEPRTMRIYCSTSIFHPSGAFAGVVASPIDTARLSEMLETLGLTPGSRAMIYEEGTATALGNNWGEASLINVSAVALPIPSAALRVRDIGNFSDPLMAEVVATLGHSMLLNRTAPFTDTIGSGRDKVFVDVHGMYDEYGLALRYVVAMPEEDFMQEIYDQQTKTIVGVVCAVVGLCVVAVLLVYFMLRALNRIAYRMALSAQLADEEANDPLSQIEEVRSMQESYEAMKDELNRVKVFLPSTVRCGEDEEEEVPVDLESVSSNASKPASNTSQRTSNARQSRVQSYAAAAAVAPKLKTAAGLATKHATVLVVNVRRFHQRVYEKLDAAFVEKVHRELVDVVQTAATSHKGVVDFFNGDHFVCTFNASRPVAQHAKAAALTAIDITSALKDSEHFSDLSMGLASGKALVGNMGNDSMRRFCTLGPLYSQAVELEGMTARYSVAVLANPEATREIQLAVYYEHVDICALHSAANNRLISTFGSARTAKEEEWMYQIEESAGNDPYAKINEAFTKVKEGQTADAKKALEAIKASDESATFRGLPALERLLA